MFFLNFMYEFVSFAVYFGIEWLLNELENNTLLILPEHILYRLNSEIVMIDLPIKSFYCFRNGLIGVILFQFFPIQIFFVKISEGKINKKMIEVEKSEIGFENEVLFENNLFI